ncbi:hypothetical protein SUGI_1156310 [Cryptomeria japonica]|nr:hypothetical protein SUGI_1156310 [Cryptomeria japonica]
MVLFGCWTYGRCNLSLCRWKVGFDPAADLQKTAPVWVHLSGLPLEYWDESIFRWTGNTFRHFMGVDDITRTKSRLVYARFCVQATISKNLTNFITLKSRLGSWIQAPGYENATLFCEKCHKAGHIIYQCKVSDPKPLKLKGPVVAEDPIMDCTSMEGPETNYKEYPFTESIIKLLNLPDKEVEGAPKLDSEERPTPKKVDIVLIPSEVLTSTPLKSTLEEGEIAIGPLLAHGLVGYPPVLLLLKAHPCKVSTPTLGLSWAWVPPRLELPLVVANFLEMMDGSHKDAIPRM